MKKYIYMASIVGLFGLATMVNGGLFEKAKKGIGLVEKRVTTNLNFINKTNASIAIIVSPVKILGKKIPGCEKDWTISTLSSNANYVFTSDVCPIAPTLKIEGQQVNTPYNDYFPGGTYNVTITKNAQGKYIATVQKAG